MNTFIEIYQKQRSDYRKYSNEELLNSLNSFLGKKSTFWGMSRAAIHAACYNELISRGIDIRQIFDLDNDELIIPVTIEFLIFDLDKSCEIFVYDGNTYRIPHGYIYTLVNKRLVRLSNN